MRNIIGNLGKKTNLKVADLKKRKEKGDTEKFYNERKQGKETKNEKQRKESNSGKQRMRKRKKSMKKNRYNN